ncbi:nucleotidyltransferase domain-containing protein [Thermofilum pendens]|uniref:DNA polymerase, beta domain protein region n=1 Tax=Thermofilum pendens (strain DSM 2475 / Hrk 5) TaxID=368408 RepID=A1RZP5_THEPD|nr:nucleotidyltransferase domain-containing protein [Thermofilum pendens]ABL78675.1 DNA polymerase, beta domain protein region [Thermofilum pendens Hrk 5]
MRSLEEIKFYEIDLEKVVETLKKYFEKRSDVAVAVLFGSALRRRKVRDIDIAVHADWSLEELLEATAELEKELGTPVDIVPLPNAPPQVRLKALAEGLPITVKNHALYTELLKEAIGETRDMEAKLREERRAKDRRQRRGETAKT